MDETPKSEKKKTKEKKEKSDSPKKKKVVIVEEKGAEAGKSKKAQSTTSAGKNVEDKAESGPSLARQRTGSDAELMKLASKKTSATDEKKLVPVDHSSPKEVFAVAPVESEAKKQKVGSPDMEEMYSSQIPKQQVGNARIYDLSQPSQLLTLPLDPVVFPQQQVEAAQVQNLALETEFSR